MEKIQILAGGVITKPGENPPRDFEVCEPTEVYLAARRALADILAKNGIEEAS